MQLDKLKAKIPHICGKQALTFAIVEQGQRQTKGGWLRLPSCFMSKQRKKESAVAIKDTIKQAKAPCPKCPYRLGLVHTLVNPCPECKVNGYKTYERFKQSPYEQAERK